LGIGRKSSVPARVQGLAALADETASGKIRRAVCADVVEKRHFGSMLRLLLLRGAPIASDVRLELIPHRAIGLGGKYTLSQWPSNSSWDFVAVGRGHDVDYWSQFLQALERVDADIEHEDQELDQFEGLRAAAETLLTAAGRTRA
jgi:hypothetical protein